MNFGGKAFENRGTSSNPIWSIGGSTGTITSDTAPAEGSEGQMWFNTSDKKLYIYTDGQWLTASSGLRYVPGTITVGTINEIIEDYGFIETVYERYMYHNQQNTWFDTGHSIPNFDSNAIYAYMPYTGGFGYPKTMRDARYASSDTNFIPIDQATIQTLGLQSDLSKYYGDPYPAVDSGWHNTLLMFARSSNPSVTYKQGFSIQQPTAMQKGMTALVYTRQHWYEDRYNRIYQPEEGLCDFRIDYDDDDGDVMVNLTCFYINSTNGKLYMQSGSWSVTSSTVSNLSIMWFKLNVTTLPVYRFTPELTIETYTH